MQPQHVKMDEHVNQTAVGKCSNANFPECFCSFTCSQIKHVAGSVFDEDRNTWGLSPKGLLLYV